MLSEWSAECSLEDPVLPVPWRDPNGSSQFIDLRANPYDLYLIPEAESHPPLMQALRALNAARSPVFTAKCDVWSLDPAEELDLRLNLDLPPEEPGSGFASYIDMVWRDRSVFTSRHRHEQVLDRLVRLTAAIELPSALLECVLRPAVIDFGEAWEGFAVSAYVKAAGTDHDHAVYEWGRALSEFVKTLRSRELGTR